MHYSLSAGLLLLVASTSALAAAPGDDFEFQLTCQGRDTMTISRADYGLSTLMWPGHHFQIAAGRTWSHLDNGDKVSVTLFRNGDQMMVDSQDGQIYFSYADSHQVVACQRTERRETSTQTLLPWSARNSQSS